MFSCNGRLIKGVAGMSLVVLILLMASCSPMEKKITPPETKIENVSEKYGKKGFYIKVSGTDERTPTDKLRYNFFTYSINNLKKPLFEASSTTNEIKIDQSKFKKEGKYRIRVSAVNEFGLFDETPAEADFIMDYTPPLPPVCDVRIEAGKLNLNILSDEKQHDVSGYKIAMIYPGKDNRDFETVINEFEHDVKKGEKFSIEVKAVDDVYNESIPSSYKVDASGNVAPFLSVEYGFPKFIGIKDKGINIEYFDDWDEDSEITVDATLAGSKIIFENCFAPFDAELLPEGEVLFEICLTDKDKKKRVYNEYLNVDITPPVSPDKPNLEKIDSLWNLSWLKVDEADSYKVYGSNDGNDWVFLGETKMENYVIPQRYLQYSVSSLDKAMNESVRSFPGRTYDENYKPLTESKIYKVEENSILTRVYSPYFISDTVTIPDGITLAMENGVELVFENDGKIKVNGQFIMMPSESDKNSFITCFGENNNDNLIEIENGEVWIENLEITSDRDYVESMISVNDDSILNIRKMKYKGLGNFIFADKAESITISESRLNGEYLIYGNGLNRLKIESSTLSCFEGLDIKQGRDINICKVDIMSTETAIRISDLTNLKVIDSNIVAKNGLDVNKFSSVEIYESTLETDEIGVFARGAATLNMRKTDLLSNNYGLKIGKNSYVSVMEGSISNCDQGVILYDESEIFFSDVSITDNRQGIVVGKNCNMEKENVVFERNEEDLTEN